jgi:hypothetical protein
MAKNERHGGEAVDPLTGEIIGPNEVIDTGTLEVKPHDPEAVLSRLRDRARSATSLDDLFDLTSGNSSDHLVGRRVEIRSVTWQTYESDRGPIPQAVVEAVDIDSGDETEFATTGALMVEFLYRAQQLKVLPFKARIVGKKTRSGQTALNFERV